MSEQPTFKNPFLSATLGSDGSSSAMGTQALEAWTQAQAKLLESTEALMKGWFDRNRAAAEATVSAMQRLSEVKDPSEVPKIWAELGAAQAQRATEAAGAYVEQCMTMWQQIAEAARKSCSPEALAREPAPEPADERPPVTARRAAS